jgi:hypothetical protein
MSNENRRQLSEGEEARAFVLGGHATFTLLSAKTGTRFTFKVTAHVNEDGEKTGRWFVKVLQGPCNETHYGYLGTIFDKGQWGLKFYHGKKSKIGPEAQSAKAFAWAWPRIAAAILPPGLEFWHEGSCCVCGRKLTVPSSIELGIGPVCAANLAA